MVGKIIKSNSFKSTLTYILDDKKGAKIIAADGVQCDYLDNLIRSFEMQRSMKPEIVKPVYHIPLSFSPKDSDKITDELMAEIAEFYIKQMGFGNTQYVAVRHHDKKHPHVHLCINRIDNDGKVIRDTKDYERNERVCKLITEKYGLHFSRGGGENYDRLKEDDRNRLMIRDTLREMLPQSYNWVSLAKLLKTRGVDLEFKYKGSTEQIEGVKFTINDRTYSGSKIGREYSYSKIEAQFANRLDESCEERIDYTQLLSEHRDQIDLRDNFADAIVSNDNTEALGGGVNNELKRRRR
ncbi:MAG: relaxase/mobilization nuclease domain-containing protein [Rikenellaceae bacterium]